MPLSLPVVTVSYFNHPNMAQRSVIVRLNGSSNSDELIVLGAHLDSAAFKNEQVCEMM